MRKFTNYRYVITGLLLITCFELFAQYSDVKWEYPIKPGTLEWKLLQSHKEMVDVCQIPDNILSALSTAELANLCLIYPLFFTMEAFNNLQEGFDQVSNEFNGFQELFRREDAGIILLNLYHSTDPKLIGDLKTPLERGFHKQKIFFIEFLLSQKIIIDKLSESEIRNLLSESLVKLDEKTKYNYSSFGTLTTPLIMCRVLENLQFDNYIILNKRDDSLAVFSKAIWLSKVEIIENLKALTMNYLTSTN